VAAEGNFRKKVLEIIGGIPRGKVLSYGQVATLAGVPRAARIVGGILHHEGMEKNLPWQRVLNAQGGLSTYRVGFGEEQRRLLEQEGVVFNASGFLDLKKYQWVPPDRKLKQWKISEETAYRIAERW
jgi:methylated-DNA-protein-cysteine methyltransferase-like protein